MMKSAKMIKIAQVESGGVTCFPALRICIVNGKQVPDTDSRVPAEIRRQPGRRTFGGRQKSAQETETICINVGGGQIVCLEIPKETPAPERERIKRNLTRGQQRLRQSKKIAKIN